MSRAIERRGLAGILAAARALPATTGETERYARRIQGGATGTCVVVADISASMAESAGDGVRKIDILRDALQGTGDARLIAFSSLAREVPSAARLPAPHGGTALHSALDLAATMNPASTLVISDGCPDSKDLALLAAERVPGVINVVYCGPDTDLEARAFMMRLARLGCGRYASHDIGQRPREFGSVVAGLLGSGS